MQLINYCFRELGSDNGCGYTIYFETLRYYVVCGNDIKMRMSIGVAYLAVWVRISFLRP